MRNLHSERSVHLAPLGISTTITSGDAALLAAAGAAYAEWRSDGPPTEPALTLILERGANQEGAAEPEIRVEGRRLTLKGPGLAGHANADLNRAYCSVPPRLCEDPSALAAEVVDTLLLFLLCRSGRTPVHAAGVLFGDTALVLAGPSGSGKSTLALAAMNRGLRILSDDTLYIELRPGLRIWGIQRPLHVFPEDAPRFTQATRLRAGKLKMVVPLAAGMAAAPFADKALLLLPERGERLDLTRLEPEAALARLARLDAGFDLLQRESAEAAQALAAGGAWRLTLTRDPGAAIDFVRERLFANTPVT